MTDNANTSTSEIEMQFVARRVKLVRRWPAVGILLVMLLSGFGAWLYFTRPLLINPFYVFSRLQEGSIPASSMKLMAAMLPVAILLCLVLVLTIVLFAFVAFANERKYQAIIRHLSSASEISDHQ